MGLAIQLADYLYVSNSSLYGQVISKTTFSLLNCSFVHSLIHKDALDNLKD